MFDRIQEMIRNEGSRLIIDINYLRAKDLLRFQRYFNFCLILFFRIEIFVNPFYIFGRIVENLKYFKVFFIKF